MNIYRHIVDCAKQLPSPNCDERPDPNDISLLVIHCISLPPDQFGGHDIDRLFCNALDPDAHPYYAGIYQLKVSAHVLIRRDGGLVQYVPFDRRAWHAGASNYLGRERCNDFSIGIELEGSVDCEYTELQYRQLAELITHLLKNYPMLNSDRIVGHSDIAPGRKTDPGPYFDWIRLRELIA
ncbi:MAG: 1,6-anhydro-N-acetylmuramyl-L-alanine amidase AmpD [Gammaproteobacteria bacterium]